MGAAVSAVHFERWLQYDGTNADGLLSSIALWPGNVRATDENGVMEINWLNNPAVTLLPGQWVRLNYPEPQILSDADFQAQYVVQP